MKTFMKIILPLVAAVCTSASLHGQARYSVSAVAEYQYNKTYGSQGAFGLLADIPVNEHFDLQPAFQTSTAKYYTAALQARALFPLPAGQIYLKNRIIFKDVARSNMYDACFGLSLGYDWDYLDVEVGMFSRFMDTFGRNYHSLDATLCEPFNLIYSIKGSVRPKSSRWNVTLGMSNVDIFEMERGWQPLFSLGGRFDVTDSIVMTLDTFCKPAGMFHLNAEFYAETVRFGLTYKF